MENKENLRNVNMRRRQKSSKKVLGENQNPSNPDLVTPRAKKLKLNLASQSKLPVPNKSAIKPAENMEPAPNVEEPSALKPTKIPTMVRKPDAIATAVKRWAPTRPLPLQNNPPGDIVSPVDSLLEEAEFQQPQKNVHNITAAITISSTSSVSNVDVSPVTADIEDYLVSSFDKLNCNPQEEEQAAPGSSRSVKRDLFSSKGEVDDDDFGGVEPLEQDFVSSTEDVRNLDGNVQSSRPLGRPRFVHSTPIQPRANNEDEDDAKKDSPEEAPKRSRRSDHWGRCEAM